MATQSKSPVSLPLLIGAMGVVFGDVGTSPLYAFKAVFTASELDPTNLENVLGVLSLIFWSITLVVGVKYVAIVLRADNDGEGGVLSLMQLAATRVSYRWSSMVFALGVAGCALFFGDGVITPAISVLSAVEGLELVAPALHRFIVPIAVVILIGLFVVQRKGTEQIGRLFGPVMLVWFVSLGVLGLLSVQQNPQVLAAINPIYAEHIIVQHPLLALSVFGAVFLCVTGGEALYADLGHFGRPAISRAFMFLVYPALLMNYFGQGALVLRDGSAIESPLYLLVPEPLLLPFIVLATLATVIASQAVISGVFSITRQCLRIDLLPRMKIQHSSAESIGQVYVPFLNWMMCFFTLALVIGFGSSESLAGAYGVGVSITMLIDSLLMVLFLGSSTPRWRRLQITLLGFIVLIEAAYLLGNLQKVAAGGWVPLVFGASLYWIMRTWQSGRDAIHAITSREDYTEAEFRRLLAEVQPQRVDKTVVFLTSHGARIPRTLVRNVQVNRVIHARTIIMTIGVASTPRVSIGTRTKATELSEGLLRVHCTVGFMETINVPTLVRDVQRIYKDVIPQEVTYVIGRDDIVTNGRAPLTRIQKAVFAFMSRNAEFAGEHLGIPPHRIQESGGQVAL
ncbi:MAG: KUP/HAK/KT family potassium transporter [Gammaproteobacteria bacterium]|nr:KUP/HAK/KT family potassium transporter [Gammaproteobacteria bacterium]